MKNKGVIWYSAGTIAFALATMVILTVVKRTCGQDAGNDFSIAFTLAQTLLMVGYFEIRPFQVTDASGKYSFCDYFTLRSFTTLAMLICCSVYLVVTGRQQWPVMLILCVYKMTDSIADIFEGDYQARERIDLAGKSMAIRVAVSVAVFTACMITVKDSFTGALVLCVSSALVVTILNPFFLRSIAGRERMFDIKGRWRKLFRECLLIAISSFMYSFMLSSSKFAVDYFDEGLNYIYYVLYLPSFVINLLSTMIFKPVLTTMTGYYKKGEVRRFMKLTGVLMFAVCVLTAVCLLGAWLLGIPVLSLVFDVDLTGFMPELLILIAGGGANAAGILMYYAVLVMRMPKGIFASYAAAFAASLILPFAGMKRFGLAGAAWANLAVMLILLAGFTVIFFYRCRKDLNEG